MAYDIDKVMSERFEKTGGSMFFPDTPSREDVIYGFTTGDVSAKKEGVKSTSNQNRWPYKDYTLAPGDKIEDALTLPPTRYYTEDGSERLMVRPTPEEAKGNTIIGRTLNPRYPVGQRFDYLTEFPWTAGINSDEAEEAREAGRIADGTEDKVQYNIDREIEARQEGYSDRKEKGHVENEELKILQLADEGRMDEAYRRFQEIHPGMGPEYFRSFLEAMLD